AAYPKVEQLEGLRPRVVRQQRLGEIGFQVLQTNLLLDFNRCRGKRNLSDAGISRCREPARCSRLPGGGGFKSRNLFCESRYPFTFVNSVQGLQRFSCKDWFGNEVGFVADFVGPCAYRANIKCHVFLVLVWKYFL